MVQAPMGVSARRISARLSTGTGAAPVASSHAFDVSFDVAKSSQLREHMQKMLDRILSLSDALGGSLNRQSLDEYRTAVKEFLGQVIDRSVQLKRDLGNGNLVSVKTVNSALERLGNLVVEREQDRLKLLDEIGEIRGLLVSIEV